MPREGQSPFVVCLRVRKSILSTIPIPKEKAAQKDGLLNRLADAKTPGLTLASFEAALRFVDYINAAFAAHHATIAVAVFQRAE